MATYLEKTYQALKNILEELSLERDQKLTLNNKQQKTFETLPDDALFLIVQNIDSQLPEAMITRSTALSIIGQAIQKENGLATLNQEMHALDNNRDQIENRKNILSAEK